MWNLYEGLLLLLLCIIIIKYLKIIWAARSLPPGPIPVPLIGNLWTLNFQLHPETLIKLAKLHGNIYTLWLGETPLVVLNGCRSVKDGIVSHSEDLSGRPVAGFLRAILHGKGIVTSNGHMWKQHRRFALMTLRNLGLGKCGLESRIKEEACCLVELFKTKNEGEKESIFNEDSLIALVIEFFNAGTETTTTSLQWALLCMVAYPDVQKKVHEELDAVLNGPVIYYEDRKRLHYTNAVIHEIQRFGSVAAVGLARTCIRDVSISGYSLHKNTMVLANLDSVLRDSQHWKTPHQFNPHHFLDKNGKFSANEAFLPFSAGARVCIGEQLARYELFIFFTILMQSFSFHLPEGVTEVNTQYVFKTNLQPHPYKICAVPR